jgi:hypothetical protein
MGYSRIFLIVAFFAAGGCGVNAEAPVAEKSRPSEAPEPTVIVAEAPRLEPEVDPEAIAAADTRVRQITVPAGTRLRLRLASTVSSRSSNVEDTVNATLRTPVVVNGVTVAPAGTAVSGYVTEARRSGRVKGRARVGVRFNALRVRGTRYQMRTSAVAREAPGTKKEDAAKIGIGAGAGAVAGAIAGGKKGAAVGTAVGAGGGTGVVLATRGREVSLGRGTPITVRLTAPLTMRVP